jgi:hypothetical protein
VSGKRAARGTCDVGDVCQGAAQYPNDNSAQTIVEARDRAYARGWRRTKGGGDVCPECQTEAVQAAIIAAAGAALSHPASIGPRPTAGPTTG